MPAGSKYKSAAADDNVSGPAAPPPRIKIRIESLSDLVFGLALSIGSLILVGRVPQSGSALAVNVLLFGFGFLLVVLTWLLYSRTMSVLSAEVPLAILLNLLLLFCVALEPYLYYLLESAQPLGLLDAVSIGYALDAGGMFLLLAALAYLVVREDVTETGGRRRLNPTMLAGFRRGWKSEALVGVIFMISALPVFWVNTPVGFLRFEMWSLTFLVLLVNRIPRRSASKEG